MMNCKQLKELVFKPALIDLLMYTDVALELMVFTCANESQGATFIKQEAIGKTKAALGIFQMQPEDYNDIWFNYLPHKPNIMLQLTHSFEVNRMPPEDRLVYDLRFATAMARIHYARVSEPLPFAAADIEGIYVYYKKYYNSELGKATYADSLALYKQFNT
jgi:hypothetical protein